jgi:hypothetical protein
MYNYYNYFEPCALMLSFNTSYPDLIKLPYFADLTQRGDSGRKEAQRQGEDMMTLKKTLWNHQYALKSIASISIHKLCK